MHFVVSFVANFVDPLIWQNHGQQNHFVLRAEGLP